MNELNLTPTETMILIPILLYVIWKLWRYDSHIELDISPQIDEVGENTTDHVKERYGAYVWLSNKHYN
ncbi:TPA: hypothetical protein TVK02_000390 [Streptococcus equi subsp. zooepidemicus]|nr:hypothetical protein [Streptococcus equi subsp. zooepidemicus]HEL1132045.1 hypothetical protein [Streptococcus equi subsp. zooepidemicus]HEL1143095.1 hypothetical protein [Streptococcus equi subsp. zooepidemicus]